MDRETLIFAAWGAATVFVLWHWAATSFLRWVDQRAAKTAARMSAQDDAEEEPTVEEWLAAESMGLASAMETVRQSERT